jgi:hypothetical protein
MPQDAGPLRTAKSAFGKTSKKSGIEEAHSWLLEPTLSIEPNLVAVGLAE